MSGILLSYRNDIFEYARNKYKTEPEYLWSKFPNYAVLRHSENRKWYAVIMDIPRYRLGLEGEDISDILEIKCDTLMSGSFLMIDGILPAYHMKKGNWLSILLDGTVELNRIIELLDMSYHITLGKKQ